MAAMMGMAGGFLTNPVLSALQATMGIGAPAAGAAPGATAASFGLPAVAAEATNTTDAHLNGHDAARMAAGATRTEKNDGKIGARDFSFLVTEDAQESGPNLSLLDDDDSGSGSDSGGEGDGEGDEDNDGYDPGSALDQLLWRQKAVSGMEVRRPGESVQQFFQRRTAGMRMLKAEAGGAEAKQLENEVDQALMNANTAWHWGQGDNDADLSDDEKELVKQLDAPSELLQLTTHELTWDPASGAPPPPPPENCNSMVVHSSTSGGGGPGLGAHAGGSALSLYDEERARAVKRRVVLGAQAIRSSGASVQRPRKDALSNEKLAPVESGRGFALLEKMGWKKGQGLGRSNDGVMLPVEAAIKTDMGGLRAESGGASETYGGAVASFGADGPGLVNESMSTGASSMMASLKATMDNEFSSITTQTKTVQQINQESRERAAAGLPPLPAEAAVPPPAAPAAAPAAAPRPAPASSISPYAAPPRPAPAPRPAAPPGYPMGPSYPPPPGMYGQMGMGYPGMGYPPPAYPPAYPPPPGMPYAPYPYGGGGGYAPPPYGGGYGGAR